MSFDSLQASLAPYVQRLEFQVMQPNFYGQLIIIILTYLAVRFVQRLLKPKIRALTHAPSADAATTIRSRVVGYITMVQALIPSALMAGAMMGAASLSDLAFTQSWLVRIASGFALISFLLAVIKRFISNPQLNQLARWIGIPLAAIIVFGYLDQSISALENIALQVGNIRISALFILKAIVFGGALFWLGRKSTTLGQQAIRKQPAIDVQTQELAAKGLEIVIFCIVGLVLLNILGMDFTTLTVFGGALGVGLGFGLQQIASNFISGIIILLERSLKVGDYVELEGGRAGILKEINMRSSTLATFDGKEIMVPNDRFITTAFVNWTKTDPCQRYEVKFTVSYDTDLRRVPPIINKAVATHARVLNEPEPPDCALVNFGDNGAEFAAEYWVDGIDDGSNKFSSEVRFLIWEALRAAGISMPFAQREVRPTGERLSSSAHPPAIRGKR